MNKYTKLIPVLLIAILTGCQSSVNDASQIKEPSDQSLTDIEILAENGFPEDLIESNEDYYLVDGDIMISKDQVNEMRGVSNDQPKSKQAYGGSGWGLVHINSVDDITIAAASNVPSAWKSAIQSAVSNWNNLSNSRITFTYQSSPSNPDITVYYNAYSGGFYAAADPAYGNDPGSFIYINSLEAGGLSSLEREEIITHEMGHTIGFRHTDWQSVGESSANNIPFTPSFDSQSVMNSGNGGLRSWNGFSSNDGVAARVLYPNSLTAPGFHALHNGETSNSMAIDVEPYYVYAPYIEVYSKGEHETNWSQIDYINYPTTSKVVNAPIPFGHVPGDKISIRIRARGFQNGLASSYSYKMDFEIEGDGGSGGCVPGFPCLN